jgi:hypothetical protein
MTESITISMSEEQKEWLLNFGLYALLNEGLLALKEKGIDEDMIYYQIIASAKGEQSEDDLSLFKENIH